MSRKELVTTLKIFRNNRNSLIKAYSTEDHDLYIRMFSLPHDSPEMEVAIDIYFLKWLNSHSNQHSLECVDYYMRAYKRLCELFLVGKSVTGTKQSDALVELVKNKIDHLSHLLEIGMRQEEKLKKLRYFGIKEQNLFDRKFNTLKD